MNKIATVLFYLFTFHVCYCVREYTKKDVLRLREEVREMFQHAYDSYLRYAYPYDELRPLSCDGVDTWGSYSLTLIDALDTLAIMGNYTEFNRVVDIVVQRENFESDINVSVFETNIRIIGGLLSAHLLLHKTGYKLEPGWPCNGPLLRLAEDVAQRLIPAFDTTTGMPYGTINLKSGVPPGETSVTCTAGVGTFIIEFGTLSRLTGDPLYEEVALSALQALHEHRSPIGLVGNHIDVMTGRWTAQDAGIGGGVDSYYEYLVKGAILLERPELMAMFTEARAAIEQHLRKDDWHVWAGMLRGHVTLPVFQSLESYWPGVLALVGDTESAMRILHNYHGVWRQYGFTPEVYHLGAGAAAAAREAYPLRPELAESVLQLYRATADPVLLQMGEDVLRSIQHSARTDCGYATIKDVRDHRKEDRMESFFLSETTKYLYLLFDPDNFIHNPGVRGARAGACVLDVGGYVFNTEAHPVDPAALHCCHEARDGINISEVNRVYQILDEEDNIKFMTMIEGTQTANETADRPVSLQYQPEITVVPVADPEAAAATDEQGEPPQLNEPTSVDIDSLVEPEDGDALIKTETTAGYENLDGSERDKKEPSNLTDMLEEHAVTCNATGPSDADVEVDDIIVAEKAGEQAGEQPVERAGEQGVEPVGKAQAMFNLLPRALQRFLRGRRASCEPQRVLERLRARRAPPPAPPAPAPAYRLLLTPAPAFLQRIALAGEVLSKKQM